ncbi:MAG: hypothetical protein JKX95_04065 [Bacteroidia bacterium]|nr:hypothetical protein [Bacteroidia bacterium]
MPKISLGQQFFRIKADFSIKEKMADGKQQLTMGEVYFDKNSQKIVYNLKFPEKETWLTTDTALYRIANGEVVDKNLVSHVVGFSIFNLSLNGNLTNYGLDNSVYKIVETEKSSIGKTKEINIGITKDEVIEELGKPDKVSETITEQGTSELLFYKDKSININESGKVDYINNIKGNNENMVITTWKAKALLRSKLGKIVMSHKQGKLYGVVFFNPEGKIISKQFYKKYTNISGLDFPTEIVQIIYRDDQENYKVTTFKNLVVNDFKEDNIYNYPIPQ